VTVPWWRELPFEASCAIAFMNHGRPESTDLAHLCIDGITEPWDFDGRKDMGRSLCNRWGYAFLLGQASPVQEHRWCTTCVQRSRELGHPVTSLILNFGPEIAWYPSIDDLLQDRNCVVYNPEVEDEPMALRLVSTDAD